VGAGYDNTSTYDENIYMQLYDADGNSASDVTLVNSYTTNSQWYPHLTVLKDGDIVVTWVSQGEDGNANGTGISQTIVSFGAKSTVTLDEDGSHHFTSSEFDFSVDSNATLVSITITAVPDNGSLTLDGHAVAIGDHITYAQLGDLTWAPDADANGDGLASFGFTSTDSNSITKTGKITFDVTAVNDAPTAADGTITLSEDGSHTFSASDFSFHDVDGDSLAGVIISGLPANGTLTLNGDRASGGHGHRGATRQPRLDARRQRQWQRSCRTQVQGNRRP
jgi:hypothetical protein